MTTTELKQYIEKVLGNSIRCLLPSYWWKRLFNQVADRIDEVEQSTSKLIESKVEEVKMPIVESVDELEKLELAKGRVAAVEKTGESATVKISDCYLSTNSEEDWGKYTIVKGVEEKDNVIIDKDTSVFFTASKGMVTKDAIQVNTISSGIFYYTKWTDDEAYVTSLEEVNKALSSGKYRAVQRLNAPDDYFTFYSKKSQPSLYIKADSWEKLSKEYVVSSEEELNALSVENGTIAKVAYDYEVRIYRNTKISNSTDKDFDRVVGLDVLSVPSSSFEITIYAQELEANNKSLRVICYGTGRIDGVILRREGNVSYREEVYNLALDYSIKADGVKRFNELLRSMDCLLEHNSYVSEEFYALMDSAFRFHIAVPAVSDAYIKGETWKRLLKEGDVTGGGESCSCTEEVIFYAADNTRGYSLTADEKAKNVEAFNKQWEAYQNKTPLNRVVCVRGDVTLYMPVAYFLPSNTSTLNVLKGATLEEYYVYVNSDGSATYSERKGLDEVLSTTSQNPVQNKVVTAALNDKADKTYVDDAVANVDLANVNFLSINANYDTFAEVKNMLNNAGVTGNSACYNYGLYYTPEGENNTMMETYMPPLYAYNTNSAWWIWCTRYDGSRHYFYAKEKYPKISNITVTGGIVRIYVGDYDSDREYNNNLNKRNFFQAEGYFPTSFDGSFFKVAFIDNGNSFYESFVPVSITTPPLFTDDIRRLYYTFTLFRNGNLETWKLMSDGSVEQTTL